MVSDVTRRYVQISMITRIKKLVSTVKNVNTEFGMISRVTSMVCNVRIIAQ